MFILREESIDSYNWIKSNYKMFKINYICFKILKLELGVIDIGFIVWY